MGHSFPESEGPSGTAWLLRSVGQSWEHGPFWAAAFIRCPLPAPKSLTTTSKGPGHLWAMGRGGADTVLRLCGGPRSGALVDTKEFWGQEDGGELFWLEGALLVCKTAQKSTLRREHREKRVGVGNSQSSGLSAKAGNPIWKVCPCLGAGGAALATRSLPTSGLRVRGWGRGGGTSFSITCHCPRAARPAPGLQTMPSRTHSGSSGSGGHSFMPGPLASPTEPWLPMPLSCPTPHLPSSLLWRLGDKWLPALWTGFMPSPLKGQMAPRSRMPSAPSRPPPALCPARVWKLALASGDVGDCGIQPWCGHGDPRFPRAVPTPSALSGLHHPLWSGSREAGAPEVLVSLAGGP